MIKVLEKEMTQWSRSHGAKFTAIGVDTDLFLDNEDATMDNNENGQVIAFVNEWLSMISDAIVGILLSHIMKISELSAFGCLQLLSDIDYLRYCAIYAFCLFIIVLTRICLAMLSMH